VKPPTDELSDLLAVAKAWDAALSKVGAIRPTSSKYLEGFLRLNDFKKLLCPSQLYYPTHIKWLDDDDKVKEAKEKVEEALSDPPEGDGF
jgi:hypothetical protein